MYVTEGAITDYSAVVSIVLPLTLRWLPSDFCLLVVPLWQCQVTWKIQPHGQAMRDVEN